MVVEDSLRLTVLTKSIVVILFAEKDPYIFSAKMVEILHITRLFEKSYDVVSFEQQ